MQEINNLDKFSFIFSEFVYNIVAKDKIPNLFWSSIFIINYLNFNKRIVRLEIAK